MNLNLIPGRFFWSAVFENLMKKLSNELTLAKCDISKKLKFGVAYLLPSHAYLIEMQKFRKKSQKIDKTTMASF